MCWSLDFLRSILTVTLNLLILSRPILDHQTDENRTRAFYIHVLYPFKEQHDQFIRCGYKHDDSHPPGGEEPYNLMFIIQW